MEKRNLRQAREIVVPGDILDASGMKPGENAYAIDGKVRACVMGVRNVLQNTVGVIPSKGCYMPTPGDTVIGIIIDIGPSNWLVDISAPYPAPLHVNEVPWRVEFGDTQRYLNIGNVILVKVLSVDESKKIQITMKDSGLRRIEGGRLVVISHSKVPRLIGKSGSMISMLKNMTNCRIIIGQNGMIWVSGDDDNANIAVEAISMIQNRTQSNNLLEKVKDLIEDRLPQNESCYNNENVEEWP